MKNIYSLMKFLLLSLFMLSSYNCGKAKNGDSKPNDETDNNRPAEMVDVSLIGGKKTDPIIKKLGFIVNSAQELSDKAESISFTNLHIEAKAFEKMFEEMEKLPDSIEKEESKNKLKILQKLYVIKANRVYHERCMVIMNEQKKKGFYGMLEDFNELLPLARKLNQLTGIEIPSIEGIQNKKDELCSGGMTVCLTKCTEYLEKIQIENAKNIEDLDDESIEESISEIKDIWDKAKILEQENPDKLKTFTAEILDKLKNANKLYESIKKRIEEYHKKTVLEKFLKPMKEAGLTKEQALIKSKKDYRKLAKKLHPDKPNGTKTLFNSLNQIDNYIKYVIENQYDSLNFL